MTHEKTGSREGFRLLQHLAAQRRFMTASDANGTEDTTVMDTAVRNPPLEGRRAGLSALSSAQANDDSHSAGLPSLDNSIPTCLRILRHLAPADDQRRDETTRALTSYVSAAVAAGYARHPDIEIPLPGPYFAEWVTIILAADHSLPNPVQAHVPAPVRDTAAALPARPADDRSDTQHQPDPGSVLLLEAAVADEETATAIRYGLTACWTTVTAQRTPGQSGRRTRLLRYLLNRHPQSPPRFLEAAAPCG